MIYLLDWNLLEVFWRLEKRKASRADRNLLINQRLAISKRALIVSQKAITFQRKSKIEKNTYITMEKLLQWSIANSQGDKEAMARAGQPDPKLLQQLFGGGGPDDPTLMKESMAVIMNPEVDLETKLVAFDNFEMLIENLDNANNIENLKLWEPLLDVLVQTKDEELRAAALSIIGTAVQNNLDSQNNFMKYDNGLRSLIEIASDKTKPLDVRTKAFYALSNLIRNHKDISEKFLN